MSDRPNVVHSSSCLAPSPGFGPCSCGAEEGWLMEQARRVNLARPFRLDILGRIRGERFIARSEIPWRKS